jgi:hypothetical protein
MDAAPNEQPDERTAKRKRQNVERVQRCRAQGRYFPVPPLGSTYRQKKVAHPLSYEVKKNGKRDSP